MPNILHNIIEVITLEQDKHVNEYLIQGWILLETYTTCYDPQVFYKHQYTHFLLGRPSTVAPYDKKQS